MKFTVDKVSLLKVLDRCKGATDSKAPMPILSHVLITTDQDTIMGCIWVSATDLFVGIKTNVHASIDTDGSIALNAKDLYDRVKLMPDGDINFSVDGCAVTMKAKGSARRYKMQGLPALEFPAIPKCSNESNAIDIDAALFAQGLENSTYASSHDETRVHLNSVLLETESGSVTFVATDGHRLAIHGVKAETGSVDSKWILPLRAAREILKLVQECASNKNANHNVTVFPDGANVFVKVNDFVFSAKLADGSFPPYQQIIPDKTSHTVTIDRREMIGALKAISVSTGTNGGVNLKFEADKLSIIAESVKGDGADEISCDWSSEPQTYGFNAQYLIDALNSFDSDFVCFGLSNELDPAVVTAKGEEGKQTAIVMPMRVS